jgi:hypothetical protein
VDLHMFSWLGTHSKDVTFTFMMNKFNFVLYLISSYDTNYKCFIQFYHFRKYGFRKRKEDPTFSRQSDHRWRLGCQHYVSAALYSPETFSDTHFR